MSLPEQLKGLAERAKRSAGMLETEEATKNALVMPFIASLGYDVFDPTEVLPEFTCDHGTKKGEKVDYAIRRDDEIVMLFEAKKAGDDLSINHASQLFRYFSVTTARIGVLTNGHVYRFFSDLEQPNKMDEKPFMELDIREPIDPVLVRELQKLSKAEFDLDTMLSAANDLKYLGEIRKEIEQQLREPGEEFVKYFFAKCNPNGRFVQSAREQFTGLVKQAFQSAITDRVSERLRTALERESVAAPEQPADALRAAPALSSEDSTDVSGIATTEEELEGFRVVRAIVCNVLPAERIAYRDAKTYFAILCDDNNRKQICRLHFNRVQKYVGLFDDDKREVRHAIDGIADLYKFAEQLRTVAAKYVDAAGSDVESGPRASTA